MRYINIISPVSLYKSGSVRHFMQVPHPRASYLFFLFINVSISVVCPVRILNISLQARRWPRAQPERFQQQNLSGLSCRPDITALSLRFRECAELGLGKRRPRTERALLSSTSAESSDGKKNQFLIIKGDFSLPETIGSIDGITFHAINVFSTFQTSYNSDVTEVMQKGECSSATISGARYGCWIKAVTV